MKATDAKPARAAWLFLAAATLPLLAPTPAQALTPRTAAAPAGAARPLAPAAAARPLAPAGPVAPAGPLADGTSAPTVPALRQWTADTGSFTFRDDAHVVVSPADAASLTATADTFAADLRSLTGAPVTTAVGAARPGDIALGLGPSGHAGDEAYRLDVGASIAVRSATVRGVFDATRTVLQLLHQGRTLGAGHAVDWPSHPERGLLLGLGRRYLTPDWIRARIRDMAYLKLDVLHLHLSDVYGFRLESRTHPEIVAAQHYTRQEMADLIAYAARYGVQVVPEIDLPGHAQPILAAHPELRLLDGAGKAADGLIDLSNPAAYALMKDLIQEFLPQFPGPYWHIGGDEYLRDYSPYPQLQAYARQRYGPDATGKDAFYGYLDWADGLVRAAGKTARAWNDGLKPGDATLTVNPDIVVEHWSRSGLVQNPWTGPAYTAQQLVDQGHRVLNAAFTPTYYTTGVLGALVTAPTAAMYDTWDADLFVDGTRLDDPSRNLGSMLSLWMNDPSDKTEPELAGAIHGRLRVMAQQTWGSPKPAPLYALYLPIIRAAGDAPA
ncbi:beta-N-acetylhexosaminidase [Actinomadura rupiterrae]|uniref:beta-N-acetylhexosaminidase n=1 Tax=Actinomadura rupiterrae TaxID=559627 RepID=UPI0020A35DF7|nr:beta-N-acetylhexosaminidase [Actinomadura rupiterrae]MCP2342585.1 hexosaminidase [Actinomadura rupiterrae]